MAEAQKRNRDVLHILEDVGSTQFRSTDIQALVVLAIGCGWRKVNAKGLVLVAYDDVKISMPVKSSHLQFGKFMAFAKTIVRHRAPASKRTEHSSLTLVEAPLGILVAEIVGTLRLGHDHVRALHDAVEEYEAQERDWRLQQEQEKEVLAQRLRVVPDLPEIELVEPEIEPEAELIAAFAVERQILSVEPASISAQRRLWDDGTVDYACPWEGCTFTHENHRSVSAHHASHTVKKQPRKSAAQRMSSDDLLQEIASLIDQHTGRYEELQGKIIALQATIDTLQTRAETAEKALAKTRSALNALGELAKEAVEPE